MALVPDSKKKSFNSSHIAMSELVAVRKRPNGSTDRLDLAKRAPVAGDDPRDRRRHRVMGAWRSPASVGQRTQQLLFRLDREGHRGGNALVSR